MWKVLVYDIKTDKKKYRHFNTQPEAEHYAKVLKQTAFNVPNPPAILIEAMPA